MQERKRRGHLSAPLDIMEQRDSVHYGVAAVETGGKQVSTGHLHLIGSSPFVH